MKTIFEIPVFLTEPIQPGSASKPDGHLKIINNTRFYLEIQIEGMPSQFIAKSDLVKATN
jgi:hypothetical protein